MGQETPGKAGSLISGKSWNNDGKQGDPKSELSSHDVDNDKTDDVSVVFDTENPSQ